MEKPSAAVGVAPITIDGEQYFLYLAMIESTYLGDNDHGGLTTWIHVDYSNGGGQGIGGYSLDEPLFDGKPIHPNDRRGKFLGRYGVGASTEWIKDTIKVVGVDSWEKLKGQYVYVIKNDGNRVGGQGVIGIANVRNPQGNLMIFDGYFERFDAFRATAKNHKELGEDE